jgi:hypothetical protein
MFNLSFVDVGPYEARLASWWTLQDSGDYAADCACGREAARELQESGLLREFPPALGHIARAMPREGGYVIGFWHEIGVALWCAC